MNLLIVVDMQKDFIDGSLGTAEAQAIVPAVKERIVEAMGDRWQVIFTKDTHIMDFQVDVLMMNFHGKEKASLTIPNICM